VAASPAGSIAPAKPVRASRGGDEKPSAVVSAMRAPRPLRGAAEPPPAAGAGRVATHTGRFLELYERSPSLSPALALDGRSDEGFKEIAVNLLILGGFLMFGFLLLL
jgi:hypothetical protein